MDRETEYIAESTLVVSVSTADGALPVGGAIVTVTSDGEIIVITHTDPSGVTAPIVLTPKIPRAEADGYKALRSYDIEVDAEGFSTAFRANIPIFPGLRSIQNISLIPLPIVEGSTLYPYDRAIYDGGDETDSIWGMPGEPYGAELDNAIILPPSEVTQP